MGFSRQEYRSGLPFRSPEGCLFLLQGIFPTQASNPGLLHYRQILYQMSHMRSPRILEWVAYPFSRVSSRPRDQTRVSCIAGRFFTNWDMREASVGEEVSKSKPKYIWTNKKWIKRETINRNSGNCLPNKCKFVIAEIDIKIMVFTWGQKVRAFFFNKNWIF